MTGTLRFRHLDVSPQDPVEQWPVEAIATALDRGELPDWHRLSLSIEAAPYGEVARRVEEALELVDSLGVAELMGQLIADARRQRAEEERRRVAQEIRQLVGRSGLPMAEFAAEIGTSASRLSTYMSGKVTPSAAMVLRMRDRVDSGSRGGRTAS